MGIFAFMLSSLESKFHNSGPSFNVLVGKFSPSIFEQLSGIKFES